VYEEPNGGKAPDGNGHLKSLKCSVLGCEGCSMSLLFFYSVWLVPFALALLAWRAGLRAIAIAGVSKASVRARTWPAMLFLAAPVAVVIVYIWLRAGHVDQLTATNTFVRIAVMGAMSSVAALAASTWAPRGFRPLAFCAAAGWAACFALVFRMIAALRALR
jgi:hypothetical protein